MLSTRMVPAAVLAAIAGAAHAVQLLGPQLFVTAGGTTGLLGVLLPVVSLVSLAASPVGVVVAGYLWGVGADVRRRWAPFVGALAVATVAGFLGTFLLLAVALLAMPGHTDLMGVFGRLLLGLGLLDVALAGLAGAAVGEFRTGESGNSSTAPA